MQWQNWSKAHSARPMQIEKPSDEAALRALLQGTEGPVRAAGSGHSFTPLCVTDGTMISLDGLSGVIDHDAEAKRATVWAGTKIHALGLPLHKLGLGLINQGDIDRQAIAGAVSTGTHGTGVGLGSVSAAVAGLRLITADGGAIDASADENADVFQAARVALGSLGVLSRLTFQCRPAYKLRERGWVMPVEEAFRRLDELKGATRHFEFWWFPYADAVLAKSLEETEDDARPLRSMEQMAQGGRMDGEQRTFARLVEVSRWLPFLAPRLNRLITSEAEKGFSRYGSAQGPVRWNHEAFPSPRLVPFNEMEFSIPAEKGADCVREVAEVIRKRKISVCFPLEYRFIAADDIWLSPFQGRDSVSISVHQYWKQDHKPLFDVCEAVFRAYGGRPHWGKLHTHGPKDLARLYPHWDDFQGVRARLDPKGRFLNPYLKALFGVV